MTILVTGGAGYIGSHTVLQLLENDYDVLVLDNLSNSNTESLNRVAELSGRKANFINGDIRDQTLLNSVFQDYEINAVIHFAGLKAVGESVAKPAEYYDNNVAGTVNLLRAMRDNNCLQLVFSSSATVYGDPASVPINETFPLSATNPYGRSKLMVEEILRDMAVSDKNWRIALLRYFNPVGAHQSGRIGEDPNGIPNNLVPYVAKVAVGEYPHVNVFGEDYDTPDGTGVRDYIHVVDLANGHLKALNYLQGNLGCKAINLGTGNGYSVLDVIKTFAEQSGKDIPYEITPRRPGDIASCYASCDQAEQLLGWKAEYDLKTMLRDHWHWQSSNPAGYN